MTNAAPTDDLTDEVEYVYSPVAPNPEWEAWRRPVPIIRRMVGVLAEMPAVGKTAFNEVDGYSFRSIDAAINALNPLLSKWGILPMPRVKKTQLLERETGRGVVYYTACVTVDYRFYGLDGDYVEARVVGEAMDLADKSISKAMTAALKVALVQAFLISTKEVGDSDPDRTTAEETYGSRRRARPDSPADKAEGSWGGWASDDVCREAHDRLYEIARSLSEESAAKLKAWREGRGMGLPVERANFDAFSDKVHELVSAERVAAEATPPAEPDPAPVAEDAPPSLAAADAGDMTLAEMAEMAHAAFGDPEDSEAEGPASDDAPPVAAPDNVAAEPPVEVPQAEAPEAPATEGPAPEATAATEPKSDEWVPIPCSAKYKGCTGMIESKNQQKMSQFRFRAAMCRSCLKEHKDGAGVATPE